MRLTLPDEAATTRLGAAIAPRLRPGEAVLLAGALGMGKSTLARGLIRALAGPDEDVPSPTFTLAQFYESDPPIAHFDLYRLTRPEEAFEIGLDEALDAGCALIEWPERLGDDPGRWLGPDRLMVRLEGAPAAGGARGRADGAPEGRVATLVGAGRWKSEAETLNA